MGPFAVTIKGGGAEGNGVLAGNPHGLMQPKIIHQGSYFDLLKAYDEQAGRNVVLQVMRMKRKSESQRDTVTASLAAALNNFPDTGIGAIAPRFGIMGLGEYMGMPCLVLPHYEHSIMQAAAEVNEAVLYSWLADVAEDLSRLHSEGRVHGAITPGKILIDDFTRKAFISGVVSYELQCILDPDRIPLRSDVVLEAPEILLASDPQVTKASDVFQFGMTMYGVLGGDVRQQSSLPALARLLKVHVNGETPVKKLDNVSLEIFNQIRRATALRAGDRPKMADLAFSLRAIAGG